MMIPAFPVFDRVEKVRDTPQGPVFRRCLRVAGVIGPRWGLIVKAGPEFGPGVEALAERASDQPGASDG